MGVRGQHNIRIVRNNVGPVSGLNSVPEKTHKLFSLLLDKENIAKADLTMIKRDMVDATKMLTPEDAKRANELINLVVNEYFANRPHYWELTHAGVLTMLDNIFTVCASNNSDGLSRRTWPLRGNPALIDIMTATGLLEKKDKVFYNTDRGNDLLKLCRKLSQSIPFEWNNYHVPLFSKSDYIPFYSSTSRVALNIDGKGYYLESNTRTNNQAAHLHEMIFYANKEEEVGDPINHPFKDVYSLKELSKKEPKHAEVMKYLFDSLNKPQIEMIPFSSKDYCAILQGTINNEPVFSRLNTKMLEFIYNVYGKDVKMTLDCSNAAETTMGRLHVFRKGSLVFSCAVTTQYPAPITSEVNKSNQTIFNTDSYNIQQLLEFGEK